MPRAGRLTSVIYRYRLLAPAGVGLQESLVPEAVLVERAIQFLMKRKVTQRERLLAEGHAT